MACGCMTKYKKPKKRKLPKRGSRTSTNRKKRRGKN